jgi:two-component system phosphate regulon response regulator OmpR
MRKRILLVDDDDELRKVLSAYLTRNGYDTLLLPDTRELDSFIERHAPHLIVLDVMMPGEDGLAACRRVRGRGENVPIIMLSARDEVVDRVVGLELGADDYVPKPFDPRELVARIEAVLRRRSAVPGAPQPASGTIRFGACELDPATRRLMRDGRNVALTTGEFALLHALVQHANRPLKRDRLLELARSDDEEVNDRAIDVQVHRLRRLVEPDPSNPCYIQTVWGAGYVFVPDGVPRSKSKERV